MTDRLSVDASEARYTEELRQGEGVVAGHESAWGWSTAAGRSRADRRARFLIEATGLKQGVSCLEIGAGTGEFTVRLLESGCDLSAIELSPATAARCRERVGDRAKVIVGNVETGEGLAGQEFDAIVGVSVLHHINFGLCLENTMSHLRPGGRFAFSEPNMRNPQVWAERNVGFIRRRRHVTAHETAFYAAKLRQEFEHAGFLVDLCEAFDFLHPWTPRPLVSGVDKLGALLEATPLRPIAGSIRISGSRRS